MTKLIVRSAQPTPTVIEVQEILGIVPAMLHYIDANGLHATVLEAEVVQIDPAPTESLKVLGPTAT